ncbi:MAG: right-handed parallel beta-helix repeat-containing protein [Mariniphaga sp.]|nr:right-handed parallel beta-helix repeat-containing protein [Mariniphaga sp.]
MTKTINKSIYLSVLAILITLTACNTEKIDNKNVFYINTQKDFDQLSGTEFPEGSKVLFASGTEFEGQFVLKGSGSEEKSNMVGTYDPKSRQVLYEWAENKAVINGLGKVESAIYLYNGQHWEINNIEITNTDGTLNDQGKLKGIYIVAENSGVMNNITIKNCFVHNVNGHVGGKWHGGIHLHVLGDSIKTKFHKLMIENNVIKDVGGVGIGNQSSWRDINTEKYYPWTEFIVRGNFIERTGRNCIILRNALNPLIEYNVAAASSRFDTGHSIVNFNTINCIVQHNEAYGNVGPAKENERGGFDADYKSIGTIIQYNYSHDNNWFCGIMRRGINTDITIRYNISQNELLGCYLYGFPTEYGLKDVKVYNNVHYFGKGKGNRIFVEGGKVRHPIETIFQNNIFYFEDEADWGFKPESSCFFDSNLFINVSPKGCNAITLDPMFVDPGKGKTNIDMRDPERLSGYRLKGNSPCIKAGVKIENNGGKDFWDNPLLNAKPNIGVFGNQ